MSCFEQRHNWFLVWLLIFYVKDITKHLTKFQARPTLYVWPQKFMYLLIPTLHLFLGPWLLGFNLIKLRCKDTNLLCLLAQTIAIKDIWFLEFWPEQDPNFGFKCIYKSTRIPENICRFYNEYRVKSTIYRRLSPPPLKRGEAKL